MDFLLNMKISACLKYLMAILVVFGDYTKVRAEYECGYLAFGTRYITAGITVKIQYYPRSDIKHITDRGLYEWILRNNTKQVIVYSKYTHSQSDRISEDNYTLSIENVQRRDEGKYSVRCWYEGLKQPMNSRSVDLKLQESFFTITKATEKVTTSTKDFKTVSSPIISTIEGVKSDASSENTKPEDTVNNTSMVVGVVTAAAVLIVLVIAGVIILRRRRASKKEYNHNDESAGIINDNVGSDYATSQDCALGRENVLVDADPYNSIDQPIRKTDLATNCKTGYINGRNAADEYSQVIPKSLRRNTEPGQGSSANRNEANVDEYACVIPKSKRAQSDVGTDFDRKTEEYTTVVPKAERRNNKENITSASKESIENLNEYSTVLPKSERGKTIDINCEYSKPVPRDQRFLDVHGIDRVETSDVRQDMKAIHHEYDTPSPVIKRRKDGLKELQYIEIDHSDSGSCISQSTESLAARPVEYVDIDFTKKAFVAPKRYPPPPSPKRNI